MLKHWYEADERLVAQCGKMIYVDRLLVKFYKTGHRVLLFSTMTKVLDIMERYLNWRTLGDGADVDDFVISVTCPETLIGLSATVLYIMRIRDYPTSA